MRACSVSRAVQDALPSSLAAGEVLSTFRRAYVLRMGLDRLVAVVAPELDDGPINIVLESIPDPWPDLQPGTPVRHEGSRLLLGGLMVSLANARTWEPRPDWAGLRAKARPLLVRLAQLLTGFRDRLRGDSLLALVEGSALTGSTRWSAVHTRAREAAEALWAGWHGDEERSRTGAACLGGLGGGLTPAGDDFLLGVMLCAWLAHPDPARHCRTLLEASSAKTTMLSAAFLRSAASGECSAPWHRLLGAMKDGSDEQLSHTAQRVLSSGHTSGADALAGFLWIGLRILTG